MYYLTITIYTKSEPPYQGVYEVPADSVEHALDRMKYFLIGLVTVSTYDFKIDAISTTKPRGKKPRQLKEFPG